MFEGFLLARREPVVVVLLGTMETTQFMKMLGALAGESATRHIKVLLCGDVYPSIAPDFREFQLIEADTEYKECLRSLYLEGYRARRDEVAVREPGTNQWIWNHPSYKAWEDLQAGALCIIGKPGSGKSVLAKTIQESQFAKTEVTSYWFYSKRKGDRFTSHASLVQAVLYQILKANRNFLPCYYQAYRKSYPGVSTWTIEDMRRVLKCLVELGKSLFCLIDALDEAENDTIMDMVGDLVFNTPNSRMKLVILSRPLKCFERKPWLDYSIILQRENQADVQKIVDTGMGRLRAAIHSPDSEGEDDDGPPLVRRGVSKTSPVHSRQRKTYYWSIKTEHQEQADMKMIRETLLFRSDGVILWVALCIEELLKLVRRPVFRFSELRDRINSLPGDMTEFYGQIVRDLQSTLSEEDLIITRETLMWVSGASELRTFHLQELWDALAASLPHSEPIPEDEDPIVFNRIPISTWNRFRRALQKLCGPFIEFRPNELDEDTETASKKEEARPDSIVQLMHQSSKDFLGDRKAAGPLHFTREEAKRLVTDGVIHYLTTSFPDATATYVPKRLSTPGSIKFWKSSIGHLVAYLEDKKLLHFALQISIRERLGAEANIANASEAYLLPKLENCDDMELLSTFRGYAFEEHFSAVDVAESAIVGRLFYLATTHGLPTAVTNLLDMSTLIVDWWLQYRNSVLNAALFAALDNDMKDFEKVLSFGESNAQQRVRRLELDGEREKSSVYARDGLYHKLRNPPVPSFPGFLEVLPGDLEDVKVAVSRIVDHWRALDRPGVIGSIGVCALDSKVRSKTSMNILRLMSRSEFGIIIFGDKVILDEPVENWPVCDFLISWFSEGFPLEKAIAYAKLRNPFCVNNVQMQMVFWDRRLTLKLLDQLNVPTPERLEVSRDGGPMVPSAELAQHLYLKTGLRVGGPGNGNLSSPTRNVSLEDDGDTLVVDGKRLRKPFVEKPVNSLDHQINIYFPKSHGGGGRRLFGKINNKNSEKDSSLHTPRAAGLLFNHPSFNIELN